MGYGDFNVRTPFQWCLQHTMTSITKRRDLCVLPSRRSLNSRRASFLSRRSCLSISSLILRASLASGLRQHAPTELRVITPGQHFTFQGTDTYIMLVIQEKEKPLCIPNSIYLMNPASIPPTTPSLRAPKTVRFFPELETGFNKCKFKEVKALLSRLLVLPLSALEKRKLTLCNNLRRVK